MQPKSYRVFKWVIYALATLFLCGLQETFFCHIRVLGLMTIPPAGVDREDNLRYFDKVRALFIDMNEKLFHNDLRHLSMGMSGDYEDAIRAGATMVRVGTAIFGSRHYT